MHVQMPTRRPTGKPLHRLVRIAAALLLLVPAGGTAQQAVQITGRVVDESGSPLQNASVAITQLQIGTLTNTEGRYTLNVPAARAQAQAVTVTASSIGYRSSSVQVTLGAEPVARDFELARDPLLLEQIVVTGAGTVQTREKLGNTINSVRGQDIRRSSEPNVVQALAAKAPNVDVTQQSGEPGASSYIRIRGPKTIQGTAQPLMVVDGVPIDNSTQSTGGMLGSTVAPNRASDLNPSDIESIEILKGASAAAIYGARAAAGVILVTTRSGQSGETRYSLQSSYTFDEVTQGVPLQTSFGHGSGGNAAQRTCVSLRNRPDPR